MQTAYTKANPKRSKRIMTLTTMMHRRQQIHSELTHNEQTAIKTG